MQYVRRAACVLFRRSSDGRILSISRGEDTTDWCLPGGEVERGESLEDAALRELREETGAVLMDDAYISLVFSGLSNYHMTSIFAVEGSIRIPHGELKSEPFEGHVAWKLPVMLCTSSCSFARLQCDVFRQLNLV